jgi:hypothetical protein
MPSRFQKQIHHSKVSLTYAAGNSQTFLAKSSQPFFGWLKGLARNPDFIY